MSRINYNESFRATGGLQRFDCLAWVNFNGTGTVAIRASGNVSSITDNGVGDYTVNFTNAMPDANYAFATGLAAGSGSVEAGVLESSLTARTASLIRVYTSAVTTNTDFPSVMLSIFR